MSKQHRFENVDVLASLNAILRQNTGFYQSDFQIDKKIIRRAAGSHDAADKTLLWLSRPSGTYCFRERDVFLKGTRQFHTWKFQGEQTRDRVLAYAVELTGREDGKIRGNLYELDYQAHFRHVADAAVDADTNRLIYERGERMQPVTQYFDGRPDPRLGEFLGVETLPNDYAALRDVLQAEKRSRNELAPGDFKEHIKALHDGLIETEAQRIVERMNGLYEPNSPNKTHFMIELSPAFLQIASSKDTDRLFSMLPYKTLSFSAIKDRHGTYALIGKDENRNQKIRKPRPSIRAQLKADKATAAPKRTEAKSKHHEMEV